MNVDGSGLRQLTKHPSADMYPTFSPDGQMIAFQSDRTGNFEIWLMESNCEEMRQLTSSGYHNVGPTWSRGASSESS